MSRNPAPLGMRGGAAVALQAVALQETLHRGGVERQALGGQRIAQLPGRNRRLRLQNAENARPLRLDPRGAAAHRVGRTWPRSRKRRTQRPTLDASSPKCRAAAAALMPRSTTAATAAARRSAPTGRPCLNPGSPPAGPPFLSLADSLVIVSPPTARRRNAEPQCRIPPVRRRAAAASTTPNPNAARRPARRRRAALPPPNPNAATRRARALLPSAAR